KSALTLATLRRQEDEWTTFLGTLGALYTRGHAVDVAALHPQPVPHLELPLYPFQRERCADTESLTTLLTTESRDAASGLGDPDLGRFLDLPAPGIRAWQLAAGHLFSGWFVDPRVLGDEVFPGAPAVSLALAAGARFPASPAFSVEDVELLRILFLPAP